MSPVLLFRPPSTASIPSSMLHRRRSWMPAPARRRVPAREAPSSCDETANPAAATDATSTLVTDTALGRTPLRPSPVATALAQDLLRVASTRRAFIAVPFVQRSGCLAAEASGQQLP